MDEENEWDHRISAADKEGPADSIRINEVAAALEKMKDKAPGLSGLVAEMMQATGIMELCGYGIYVMVMRKKVASQRTGSQVWFHQLTKGKGIQ